MRLVILATAITLIANPVFAKGQHIICHTEGTLETTSQTPIQRTLTFYLDDTGEQLVSDNDKYTVATSLYSDAKIEASIHDTSLASIAAPLLFGNILDGKAFMRLDRVKGYVVLSAKLHPGADFEAGPCTIAPAPARKF